MAPLSIIIVQRDRVRAHCIVAGLLASGNHHVTVIADETGLAGRIAGQKPDIVLIDVANPSGDILAKLATAKAALEDRKFTDRAKAILMKARGIDEATAYALLRKTAMDQKRRVADVAQQVVMAAGLLT